MKIYYIILISLIILYVIYKIYQYNKCNKIYGKTEIQDTIYGQEVFIRKCQFTLFGNPEYKRRASII